MEAMEDGGGGGAEEQPTPPQTETPAPEPSAPHAPEPEEVQTLPEAVTPQTTEEEPPSTGGTETSEDAQPRAPGRSRAWLWGTLGLLAVAIVGVVIGSRLGGLTQPLNTQSGGSGRPTIVVGTAAVAPSAVISAPSPSAVPSTVVAGATAVSAREYVVKPGDTLQSIAQDQYGDAGQWPRIYDANRDVIGPNPDALVAGSTLHIPAP